jgi:hypothetical protein
MNENRVSVEAEMQEKSLAAFYRPRPTGEIRVSIPARCQCQGYQATQLTLTVEPLLLSPQWEICEQKLAGVIRPTLLTHNAPGRATPSSKAIKTLEFLIPVHGTLIHFSFRCMTPLFASMPAFTSRKAQR